MQRFPNTVDDLIRDLDGRYPEVRANPGDDPQEILHRAIQRGVVLELKERRARALRLPEDEQPQTRGRGRDVHS